MTIEATERTCLKCGHPFLSTKPKKEHRICDVCAKGNDRLRLPANTKNPPIRKGGESRAN